MEKQQMDDPSSKEKAKTWGFRRSTIARREFIEEIGNLDLATLTPRRAARQGPRGRGRGRGRGKQVSETTFKTTKSARGGRRSVKASREPEPDLEDLQTASHPPKTASDTEASDSDELTLRELQERARKRHKSEEGSKGSPGTVDLTAETINDDDDRSCDFLQSEESVSSLFDRLATSSLENWKSDRGNQLGEDEERDEEQNDADESSDADGEYSDPNAVYCICRQKHNNRFMICCDRCHEWFHGDCVGISQARGRLLEKNGEDYICPSCSPCQSPISVMQQQPALTKPALSSSSESLFTSSAGEERPSEDEGIKGKIRKSSGRSIKRRIKIFQRVELVEETPEPIHQAVVMEQDMSEDTVEKVKEKPAVPKCIGPGCSNDALPESVYCGHQCIIRHAAVAMHGLSEPKEQPEIKTKPAPKPTLKIHNLGKLFKKKSAKKPAEDADGGCKEMGSTPAASPTPDPVHKPMGEQQPAPAAIASSQFYRATSTISEKVAAERKPATPVTTPTETQNLSAPSEAPAAEKADEKPAPLVPTAPSATLAPPAPLVSSAPLLKKPNPLPSRAKKTMPGSPRLSASRQLHSETPQANKSVFTVPNKPCQAQEASNITQASNSTPEFRVLPVTPAPVPSPRPLQPHPNMQMRQNIRRSLTDTLLKRVIDDDLEISESNVEKLAVNIEREMFNMYYTTDNKYKIKYRSLLLSLKDPKNKGLFYQVVKGHITPFKLTRLSDLELLSVQESTADPVPMKEEGSPVCVDMEQPLSVSENKVVKTDCVAMSSLEGKMSLAQVRQAQSKKPSPAVSDIISSMLKDTTAEHKAHLFDLKCRICTGQIFVDEEPDAKTIKKDEQMNEQEEKPPCAVPLSEKKPPSATPGDNDVLVMESPASPTTEDCSIEITQPDFAPPVIPAVSIVTITRRDPRTAGYRSAPPPSPPSSTSSSVVPAPVPDPFPAPVPVPDPPKNITTISSDKEADVEIKAVEPLQPPAPPPPMPKSILMKPSASSISRFYSSTSLTTRLTSSCASTENDTSHFLSRQDTIWKGFLNMQLVAKFVTKGCLISGSAEVLKKDLPDTIHIGGRILPQTVWEYVERVKTSLTKEMSLIRFYPASDEEEVAYVSLFSYFNSRRRFGVVSNICNNIKDLYLIPLCTNESIPSVLLPIDGPGLELNHPSLLIGLAICQKLKRSGPQTQEIDEKRPRIQTPQDSDVMSLPTKSAVPDAKHDKPYDPEITISTTPPDSPLSLRSPDSTLSSLNPLPGTSVLSDLHALLTPPTSSSTDVAKTSVPTLCVPPSTTATPLQTILNTIFGKQKQSSDFAVNTNETSSTAVKEPAIPFLTADPIVQQYQQTPKATVELDDNDRPYDPEEEYDPALGYQNLAPSKPLEISKPNALPAVANEHDVDDDRPYDPEEEYNVRNNVDSVHASNTTMCTDTKLLLKTSARKEDVAYDPEDDTVFEEMQNYLTDKNKSGTSGSMSLSEQQKMLEDLNRQIEEQKRQLEEQEEALRLQRAAVGVSMAHFSVSDALMSPPPRFGREPDEEMEKTLNASAINLNRDPRQYRNLQQNFVNPTIIGHTDKENVNEKFESSKSNFLASNSLEQDLSKNDNMTLSKLDEISINADTTVLCSERNTETNTHQGASALQEGTSSSSGNDNIQRTRSPTKDSGKTRQSHTSRRQHHSSPQRRSRHETRRSYHEKRTSDQSKDDGHRRRGRHSPERTSRRSRSCSRRKERASSREKERYHHKSTSSRQSSRRDRRYSSSRSRSNLRPTSPELENKVSNQNKKLVLRQKDESNTESTDSTNNAASEQPEIQGDKSQNEASGKIEKKETKIQKADNIKLEPDQSEQRGQKRSDPPCIGFSQSKQVNLESNRVNTNQLQREDFHKSSPQSEKLSLQQGRNNESFDTRHQLGNQKGNTLHNNEIDFHHGTDKKSSWLESDCLPQKTHKIEREYFPEPDETFPQNPQPQRLPHLRGSTPEVIPPQNQKSCFSVDGNLHPRDLISQGAHSVTSVGLENDVHRNIHPQEQFRLRTPEIKWRGPQHRMDGPRGPTLMQPRIPRAPHPEGFETYRPLGPRPKRLDDCGPAPNFGPRGPRMFDGPGPRSLRPRCPSPVPRMFEGASRQLSGPKGRFPTPGRFEGFERQNVGPIDAFSGPDMFDDSLNFAESPQREFDCRDPGIQDCDDSWESDVPHQVDEDLFSEFRRPRERGAPQRFCENMLKARDSERDFSDFRDCEPPFDEAEIEHLPCQYSDDQSDYHQTFANERFLNPQEPKSRRNPTPRPAHTRYPIHNQLEGPQFPMRELSLKRSHKFDDFRDQANERETIKQHFAKPEIFESSGDSERAAQIKGPRINPPQNLRGSRAPYPHFCDERMLSSRNTQLLEDKPSSSHFSLPSTSKPLRPLLPRSRLSGRTKEPGIRPLRLSGPLLPTPPGGPIRFHDPRMQRPNLPQRPLARRHIGDLAKPAMMSGCFDDDLNNHDAETYVGFIEEEFVDQEEEYSGQDNSPGRPWCREARRRNSAARRGHSSE